MAELNLLILPNVSQEHSLEQMPPPPRMPASFDHNRHRINHAKPDHSVHFSLLSALMVVCSLQQAVGVVEAKLVYQSNIPNGANVQRNGAAWPGVGHTSSGGGGATNPFGAAFASAGHTWTVALCQADTDGDGYTNGVELGDPNCVWTTGATPARTTDVSHPGFADSVPATVTTPDPTTPYPTTATPEPTNATPEPTNATPEPTTANSDQPAFFVANIETARYTELSFKQLIVSGLAETSGSISINTNDVVIEEAESDVDPKFTTVNFFVWARGGSGNTVSALQQYVPTIAESKLRAAGVSSLVVYSTPSGPLEKKGTGVWVVVLAAVCALLVHPTPTFALVSTLKLFKPGANISDKEELLGGCSEKEASLPPEDVALPMREEVRGGGGGGGGDGLSEPLMAGQMNSGNAPQRQVLLEDV